ncbi:MAG TPA: YeeE/YedE family protein [Candidatus Binatia bacterium]|jgi:uncharacterized membrane protein YedE/YeeE|nr:YeeE/YedE family protein [Candidatus Binatia bacterium]
MENFTPISSLIGGILIGLSGSALLLFNGRIAGISGILGGVVSAKKHDALWRAAFVAGLLTGGLILRIVTPGAFQFGIDRSAAALVIAGFIVGLGSRIANGCTSGHGVCGISRFSPRSIVATTIFIIVGAAAVYVINHFLGGAV